MRRSNGVDNLHTLVYSYHALVAFYFFINIKIPLTPYEIYKKKIRMKKMLKVQKKKTFVFYKKNIWESHHAQENKK